jgi:hypothetical protein
MPETANEGHIKMPEKRTEGTSIYDEWHKALARLSRPSRDEQVVRPAPDLLAKRCDAQSAEDFSSYLPRSAALHLPMPNVISTSPSLPDASITTHI